MKKYYVLDTCVLINDPAAYLAFEDNTVVIPIFVLEELDKLKQRKDFVGYNARQAIKQFAEAVYNSDLQEEVPLDNGGNLLFYRDWDGSILTSLPSSQDNYILASAVHLQKTEASRNGNRVVFVTNDLNCGLKGAAVGLAVEEFKSGRIRTLPEDSVFEHFVQPEVIDTLYQNGFVEVHDLELSPNGSVVVRDYDQRSALCVFKVQGYSKQLQMLKECKIDGIKPLDMRQRFAISALCDDEVPLCILEGPAGTGKTFIALAVAIEQTFAGKFKKILVAKPTIAVDSSQQLGYLPGSLEEKLDPWLGSIRDNISVLGYTGSDVNFLSDILEPMSIEHIRGRSIREAFIILDEAQNLTKGLLKTILTRAAENTKIVVCGDISQIDNVYVDRYSNGLSALIEATMDSDLASYVKLTKCVRSPLAKFVESAL